MIDTNPLHVGAICVGLLQRQRGGNITASDQKSSNDWNKPTTSRCLGMRRLHWQRGGIITGQKWSNEWNLSFGSGMDVSYEKGSPWFPSPFLEINYMWLRRRFSHYFIPNQKGLWKPAHVVYKDLVEKSMPRGLSYLAIDAFPKQGLLSSMPTVDAVVKTLTAMSLGTAACWQAMRQWEKGIIIQLRELQISTSYASTCSKKQSDAFGGHRFVLQRH